MGYLREDDLNAMNNETLIQQLLDDESAGAQIRKALRKRVTKARVATLYQLVAHEINPPASPFGEDQVNGHVPTQALRLQLCRIIAPDNSQEYGVAMCEIDNKDVPVFVGWIHMYTLKKKGVGIDGYFHANIVVSTRPGGPFPYEVSEVY